MTTATTQKLTLSIREVAEALGVTRQSVRNYYQAGKLPPPLPGTRSRWSRVSIDRYLAGEWQLGGWVGEEAPVPAAKAKGAKGCACRAARPKGRAKAGKRK
jgi:excisionase family DNA binding protein